MRQACVGAHQASFFFTIPHPWLFLPPSHQTISSTFSPCLRIWLILLHPVYDDGKGGGWNWWGGALARRARSGHLF